MVKGIAAETDVTAALTRERISSSAGAIILALGSTPVGTGADRRWAVTLAAAVIAEALVVTVTGTRPALDTVLGAVRS